MDLEPILAGAIVLLFVLIVGWIAWTARRQQTAFRESLLARGLSEVKPVDPALLQRVRGLYPRAELKNLYRMNRAAYQLYIFDLDRMYSDDAETSSRTCAALVSPDLRLPRLVLFPAIQLPVFGGLFEKIIQGFLRGKNFQRVAFPEHPTFDKAYLLLGPDEAALRQFFTRERLNHLAELKYFSIEGLEDLLVYSRFASSPQVARAEDPLALLVDGASILYSAFRE